jgi:hypothetical protein
MKKRKKRGKREREREKERKRGTHLGQEREIGGREECERREIGGDLLACQLGELCPGHKKAILAKYLSISSSRSFL